MTIDRLEKSHINRYKEYAEDSSDVHDRTIPVQTMRSPIRLPLRWFLVVPFVLQVSIAVGVTGVVSIRNGQRAVRSLSRQLMESTTQVVDQHLTNFLSAPVEINQTSANLIQQEVIDINDLEILGQYFWHEINNHSTVSYAGFTSQTGHYIGAGRWLEDYDNVIDEAVDGQAMTYSTDSYGNREKIVYTYDYSPQDEDWYSLATESKQPVWTLSVEDVEPLYVAAIITHPVFDLNGQLLGVVGSDLVLSDISHFLTQVVPAEGGRLYILESDGKQVANSEIDVLLTNYDNQVERANGLDSLDELTRASAQMLQDTSGGLATIQTPQLHEFSFEGMQHFVHVTPWYDDFGLEWLIVAVIPQSAFIAEIEANTRTTAYLCLGALATAIILGFITSRWIVRPILELNSLSRNLTDSSLDTLSHSLNTSTTIRIQELEILTQSFMEMAEKLQISFTKLEATNVELEERVDARTAELSEAIATLKRTQTQLIHTEKMSSLGQLVAGIGHEINNPVNFIYGNLTPLQEYVDYLLNLIDSYQANHPDQIHEDRGGNDRLDLAFIKDDLPQLLHSLHIGSERIFEIVTSLRDFSHHNEMGIKSVDIHDGINSTLLILQHRLKANAQRPVINVVKQFDHLQSVECFAGTLNQVFMNILVNAIDALEDAMADPDWNRTHEYPEITIQTSLFEYEQHDLDQDLSFDLSSNDSQSSDSKSSHSQSKNSQINHVLLNEPNENQWVRIAIADNALGIPKDVQKRVFEPFFTTKEIGKGTGMGLSISYQIITETHHGTLSFTSNPEQGTCFVIKLPLRQSLPSDQSDVIS